MPRLSNDLFIERHHVLRDLWLHQKGQFGLLEVSEQWDRHPYFVPYKELTDSQLLEHRQAITKKRPSLPNVAGKALVSLRTPKSRVYDPAVSGSGKQLRQIHVSAVARPEPDIEKLAKALLEVAREMQSKEKRTPELLVDNHRHPQSARRHHK